MNASDIRLLSDVELESEIDKAKRDLLNMRCRIGLGEEVKPGEVKSTRRDIARMKTIQRQRQMEQTQSAGSEQ